MSPNAAPPATRSELLHRIAADPVLSRLFERVQGLSADDPAHDVEHLLRVALLTLKLAGAEIEPRSAVCAALLHDVVNLPKNHPERARASEWSAAKARELLASEGLSAEALAEIAEAIEDHSYSSGRRPRSPLGRALQDADRLEALGALGIARTFSTGVRLGARYFDADDPWAQGRELDDKRFSVDHFFTKLLALPQTLCTEAGRAEAERRAEILRGFLRALGDEIGAPISDARLR
jgi:uncharacterized protein